MNRDASASLECWIYRSSLKEGMYLYLREVDCFDAVPAPVLKAFGKAAFVMQLELSTDRQLAQADVSAVMSSLVEQGYFLQVPPPVESLLKHRPD